MDYASPVRITLSPRKDSLPANSVRLVPTRNQAVLSALPAQMVLPARREDLAVNVPQEPTLYLEKPVETVCLERLPSKGRRSARNVVVISILLRLRRKFVRIVLLWKRTRITRDVFLLHPRRRQVLHQAQVLVPLPVEVRPPALLPV